jgi:hypothetical protein
VLLAEGLLEAFGGEQVGERQAVGLGKLGA